MTIIAKPFVKNATFEIPSKIKIIADERLSNFHVHKHTAIFEAACVSKATQQPAYVIASNCYGQGIWLVVTSEKEAQKKSFSSYTAVHGRTLEIMTVDLAEYERRCAEVAEAVKCDYCEAVLTCEELPDGCVDYSCPNDGAICTFCEDCDEHVYHCEC